MKIDIHEQHYVGSNFLNANAAMHGHQANFIKEGPFSI